MSDNRTFDYYRDVLANSLGLLGISVTAAQLEDLAADIANARENESTAFGDEVASSNLIGARDREIQQLRSTVDEYCSELRRASNELASYEEHVCPICDGRGIDKDAPMWPCPACRGSGKLIRKRV